MFYEAHNIEVEINCVYIGASLDIQKGGKKNICSAILNNFL